MDDAEFSRRRTALSDQVKAALARMFGDLGSWRDDDAERFVDQAVPVVDAGQQTLAQLTSIYIASQVSEGTGQSVTPPGVDPAAVTRLRGIDPATVYTRPFVTLRTGLARGKPIGAAVELGQTRLAQIAEGDLQQSYAHASQQTMRELPDDVRPRFWARVLQGEYDCALCVVASTQRYTLGDLNPIHPACDCIVKPLAARRDPGQTIAPELLERVHAAVEQMTGTTDRGARAPDYRKLMTQMTDRHGELGTLLVRPGDHFDGPGAIPG